MSSHTFLPDNYWTTLKTTPEDFSYLFNYLLECETPLTTGELLTELVKDRITREKKKIADKQKSAGRVYLPREHYKVGTSLSFPQFDDKKGKVLSIRPGNNPEYPPFDVIEVDLEDGEHHAVAAGLENHPLNDIPTTTDSDEGLDGPAVIAKYAESLTPMLEESLKNRSDLVRIAGRWFAKSLLVDVNAGHLNLAEATLDMANGGPLATGELQKQVELASDVNPKLLEFSLNYALQEDARFDEVGPSGEVIWYLHRCEPVQVREIPFWLQYSPSSMESIDLPEDMHSFCVRMADELDDSCSEPFLEDEVILPLIYPHWRAGTLPLNHLDAGIFPTALESPRIQFTFVNGNNKDRFTGWVVRNGKYLYGLKSFYESEGLIPGSLIHIKRSTIPGEVIIRTEKSRSNREWVRTALIGADGGIVFALLKQPVTATYDERMAILIPDIDALDALWNTPPKQKGNPENLIINTLRNLAKLNPQGHVHAQELYSAINIIKRMPVSPILLNLVNHPQIKYVGDYYFRVSDNEEESA
jgi:hypothetical protein